MSQEQNNSSDQATQAEGVMSRRKLHEAAALLVWRWTSPLIWLFVSIGFFLGLLPVLFKPWREIIQVFPITKWMFFEIITMGQLTHVWFYLFSISFVTVIAMRKHHPAGWQYTKDGRLPGPKDLYGEKLYPRTCVEEFVFWADFLLRVSGIIGMTYLPFGLIASVISNFGGGLR